MRYEKGHKESTHRRIVETAVAQFRKNGIDNVGVADLMAEAGLTHGGFYSHFQSKEELVKAAMDEGGVRSLQRLQTRLQEGGVECWIRNYLTASHRDHPETGCTAAALSAELARHPKSSRNGFTETVGKISALVAEHLPGDKPEAEKRKTAFAIFGSMIGTVQLARAVDDPTLSDQILETGITTALAIAGIEARKTQVS
jgi:AcrR family transcriptional regulator